MSTLKRDKKSLLITNPDLVKEWDYVKNADLDPKEISPNSHRKAWWKCSVCDNEWEAVIASRNRGNA